MNMSYSLNAVCPKFMSNLQVFRKVEYQFFEVLLYMVNFSLSVVRKLQEFESPYISLKSANKEGTFRIVLRRR